MNNQNKPIPKLDKKMRESMTKGKQDLYQYLGKPYEIMWIDLEKCIYLQMDNFMIEISGGDTIKSEFHFYVWQTKGFRDTVEAHFGVKGDLEKLKGVLDDIRNRFEHATPNDHRIYTTYNHRSGEPVLMEVWDELEFRSKLQHRENQC